jgi:hypothetical protein
MQRQTVGGGLLLGDSLAKMTSETYIAAEGFSGDYIVTVERVWGRPLGSKAQLKIIRHQGTKDETEELVTVRMNSNQSLPITVNLKDGRRTETAYVPSSTVPVEEPTRTSATDEIFNKLRALSDPEITGFERGIRGGTGSPGKDSLPRFATKPPRPSPNDRTVYQNKVKPLVQGSVDVTAQAVISADRRYVRLSMAVSATQVTRFISRPVTLVNPIFPGGVIPPGPRP